MERKNYIDVSQEIGKAFVLNPPVGPVTMLNLLKFRDVADYSKFPHLQSEKNISGKAAYDLYMTNTTPFLEEIGSKILLQGNCSSFLIGPQNEDWDFFLLVKHPSAQQFLAFASHPDYQKIVGHRTAALLDSRLLAIDVK